MPKGIRNPKVVNVNPQQIDGDTERKLYVDDSKYSAPSDRVATFSEEIVTDPNTGGMQSKLEYRFDLVDPYAMFQLAGILDFGAKKYAPNNWRKLPIDTHINHALAHIWAYQDGDTQEDHLGHAFCRLMFALGVTHDTAKQAIKQCTSN